MKDRVVYVLVVVFVALGAGFFFAQSQWEKAEKAEEEAKRVVPVEQEAVTRIDLKNTEGEFRLEKKDNEWMVTHPVEYPADMTTVDSMINSLAGLKSQRVFEEPTEAEKKEYGLDSPEITVTVQAGEEKHRLLVGSDAATEKRLYASREGEKRVLVVDNMVRERLEQSLYDLRNKDIFAFNTSDARRVSIQTEEKDVAVEKKAGDQWRLEQPMGARASGSEVRSLLSKIRFAEIKAFADDQPEDLEPYGLVEPATKITVWSGDERSSESLLIGKSTGEDQRLYARKEGLENVFELEKTFLEELVEKTGALRETKLSSLTQRDVQSLEIMSATGTVAAATRDEERAWHLLAPVSGEAKVTGFSDWLTDILELEIVDFIDEPGPESEYRLAEPDYVVNLQSKDAGERLTFGVMPPSATDEMSVDAVYAMRPDEPFVFEVDPAFMSLVKKDFSELLKPAPAPAAATEELAVEE